MEREHPQQDQDKRRGIGDLDCLSICVLLAHGIDGKNLQELLEPMIGACCRHKLGNPTHLLQMAHSTCHTQEVFARMVSEALDLAHVDIVSRVAGMEVNEIVERLTPGADAVTIREQAGLAWALLRSEDEQKRGIGSFLVHAIFQRIGRSELARAETRCIELEHQSEALGKLVEQKQQVIDDMLAYIHRTRPVAEAAAVEGKT